MTISHTDMEQRVAEAVTPPSDAPRMTRIMLIAQTAALGDVMQNEMTQDPNVAGIVRAGTLSSVLEADTNNCITTDFVVFEISDIETDLLAVNRLKAQAHDGLQCIAVSKTPVEAAASERLRNEGVSEVMTLNVAPVSVQFTPTAPVAQTGGQVVVLLRARGGAGATTLAVNLAVGQAAKSSTALIDLDIQNGAVALALDLPDSAEVTKLVKGQTVPDSRFLDRAMQRHLSGVDVLTAPDVFAPLSAITPELVARLIDILRARYDHIVLDMPQAVVEWIAPVLERASRVILVSDMTLPSLKRSKRLLDLISEEHMTLPVQVVINFEKRPLFQSAAHKEAANLIGQPLEHWVPADATAARRAMDLGIPLMMGAKRSLSSKAIANLGAAIFKPIVRE